MDEGLIVNERVHHLSKIGRDPRCSGFEKVLGWPVQSGIFEEVYWIAAIEPRNKILDELLFVRDELLAIAIADAVGFLAAEASRVRLVAFDSAASTSASWYNIR